MTHKKGLLNFYTNFEHYRLMTDWGVFANIFQRQAEKDYQQR